MTAAYRNFVRSQLFLQSHVADYRYYLIKNTVNDLAKLFKISSRSLTSKMFTSEMNS